MADENPFGKLQRHMLLSQTLGAPTLNIPGHAVAVTQLVLPYLATHTTPREAAVVMATVYAYFAAVLTRGTNTPEEAIKQAHELLDAAIVIVADLDLTENEEC